MRVVLDTNIFVSALLDGRLGIILDEWRAGKWTLIVSEAIVREYLAVLQRPKFGITTEELTATMDYLFKKAEFVSPAQSVDVGRTTRVITSFWRLLLREMRIS